MFNKFKIGAAGVALISTIGMASVANAAASDTATAEAEILEALTLTSDGSSLDFGQIAVNGAGTVVVDPVSGAVTTCTANLVCAGTSSFAHFDVTGSADAVVYVTVPSSALTITEVGGDTMTVSNFTSDTPTATLSGGSSYFDIGGQLNVSATQVAGTYTGTFSVSVEYQ